MKYWLPEDNEIGGNLFYKDPNCKIATKNAMKMCKVVRFIEPNYGYNGLVLTLKNASEMDVYDMMTADRPKCDGLMVPKKQLYLNKYGMIGRSRDSLILALESEEYITLLHIGAESLNCGILLNIPSDCKEAVLGPCISGKYYALEGEALKKRTSNYQELNYDKYCYTLNGKTHINIKDIVLNRLNELNIKVLYNDTRCTYETEVLGSFRRKSEKSNSLIVW